MSPINIDPNLAPSSGEVDLNLAINPIEAIETIISSLDAFHNALVNHGDDSGYIWKFKYGSVTVWVQLTGTSEDDTLTVWAPILQLPVQNQPQLLERLMAWNWLETLEAHFASFNQQIVVVSSRSVADLSVGEISRLITLVASLADDYDDALQNDFPGLSNS